MDLFMKNAILDLNIDGSKTDKFVFEVCRVIKAPNNNENLKET